MKLVFFLLVAGCTGGAADFPIDTDTDTDADTDTDTNPNGSLLWILSEEIADLEPTPGGQLLITANVTDESIDIREEANGTLAHSWPLGSAPDRMAVDHGRNEAAVTYGEDGPTRVDLVDLGTGGIRSLDLKEDGLFVHGLDVAWFSGELYVFVEDPDSFRQPHVQIIDPDGMTVLDTWFGGDILWSERIAPKGNAMYIAPYKYAPPTAPGEEMELKFTFDATPHVPHRLEAALARDQSGILFTPGANTLVEYDPRTGASIRSYAIEEDGVFGAIDYAYTGDQQRVVSLSLDFDQHVVQVFDRDTGDELVNNLVLGPEELDTVLYEREFMVIAADDARAYVVVWDGDAGAIKRVSLASN